MSRGLGSRPGTAQGVSGVDQAEPGGRPGADGGHDDHGAHTVAAAVQPHHGKERQGQGKGHPGQHHDHRAGIADHHRRAGDQFIYADWVLLN